MEWTLVALATPMLLVRLRLHLMTGTGLAGLDLFGVSSDLGVALLAAAVLQLLAGPWRWAIVAAALANAIALQAHAEHVLTLGGELTLRNVGYAVTPTFFWGSIIGGLSWWSVPMLGAAVLSVPAARVPRVFPPRWLAPLAVVVALPSANHIDSSQAHWRQRNVYVSNLPAVYGRAVTTGGDALSIVDDALRPNLDGTLRIPRAEGKRNVVVVLVEGLAGGYIPRAARFHGIDSPVKMPRLSALARDNLHYMTLIHQQRQSNRGNYAILCGDYPDLNSGTPKAVELVEGAERRCLPQILADHGYRTVFSHPGNLRFMAFDRFAEAAGFEEILDVDDVPRGQPHTGWGPDDRTYLQASAEQIIAWHADDRPFFATLFTTGTHHPYAVPAPFRPELEGVDRAFAFTDVALDEFVAQLRDAGVLDDTLVVITSEESTGISLDQPLLTRMSQNWAGMVVLVPGGLVGEVTVPHLASDLGLTLLDHLDLAHEAPHFVGRSLFREYREPRWLPFANIYFERAYLLGPERKLLDCDVGLVECTTYAVRPQRLFGPRFNPTEEPEQMREVLAGFLDRSARIDPSRAATFDMTAVSPLTLDPATGQQMVFGAQGLNVGADEQVRLTLALHGGDGPGFVSLRVRASESTPEGPLEPRAFLEVGPIPVDGGSIEQTVIVGSARELRRLEWNLYGHARGDTPWELVLDRAEIRIEPATTDQVQIEREQLDLPAWSEPTEVDLTLVTDSGEGYVGAWSFEAPSAGRQLLRARVTHATGPSVRLELWQGDRRVCTTIPAQSSESGIFDLFFVGRLDAGPATLRAVDLHGGEVELTRVALYAEKKP